MQDKKLHNVAFVFDALKSHYKLRTLRELATFLDVKEGTLNAWKARNSIGDADLILAKCRGLSYEWLKTGKGEMFPGGEQAKSELRELQPLTYETPEEALARGYVHVPRYEISASAGGGALVYSEQIVDVMSFKSDYLKVSLGLSPKNVAVISVVGDSMEPYLSEGDLVMVDLGVTSIQNNAVYVLQFGDSLLVKRVQVKLDGEVIVKSDNPRYEPESFRGEAAERLRVVGRMVRRLVR